MSRSRVVSRRFVLFGLWRLTVRNRERPLPSNWNWRRTPSIGSSPASMPWLSRASWSPAVESPGVSSTFERFTYACAGRAVTRTTDTSSIPSAGCVGNVKAASRIGSKLYFGVFDVSSK